MIELDVFEMRIKYSDVHGLLNSSKKGKERPTRLKFIDYCSFLIRSDENTGRAE